MHIRCTVIVSSPGEFQYGKLFQAAASMTASKLRDTNKSIEDSLIPRRSDVTLPAFLCRKSSRSRQIQCFHAVTWGKFCQWFEIYVKIPPEKY
jgi:hypothetical protein